MVNKETDSKQLLLLASVFIVVTAAFFTKKIFFSVSGPIVVDYWAFAAGIFLVSDGLWDLMRSRGDTGLKNFFKLLRISVGACIFTIHFLQFIRDGKLGA